jgi:hypothetical protein
VYPTWPVVSWTCRRPLSVVNSSAGVSFGRSRLTDLGNEVGHDRRQVRTLPWTPAGAVATTSGTVSIGVGGTTGLRSMSGSSSTRPRRRGWRHPVRHRCCRGDAIGLGREDQQLTIDRLGVFAAPQHGGGVDTGGVYVTEGAREAGAASLSLLRCAEKAVMSQMSCDA